MNLKLFTNLNIQSIQFLALEALYGFWFLPKEWNGMVCVFVRFQRGGMMSSDGWKPQTNTYHTRVHDKMTIDSVSQCSRIDAQSANKHFESLASNRLVFHCSHRFVCLCIFNDFFGTCWTFNNTNTIRVVLLLATLATDVYTWQIEWRYTHKNKGEKSYLIEEKLGTNALKQVI